MYRFWLLVLKIWNFVVIHRIVHFILIGGLSTVVNISTTFVLTSYFGLWYIASAIVAFVAAYAVNFTLQKVWTFQRSEKEGSGRQLLLHLPLQLCNLALELGGMYTLVEYAGLWYLLAQMLVLGPIAAESFVLTRLIFAPRASGA